MDVLERCENVPGSKRLWTLDLHSKVTARISDYSERLRRCNGIVASYHYCLTPCGTFTEYLTRKGKNAKFLSSRPCT
jgi:hypothetical protein